MPHRQQYIGRNKRSLQRAEVTRAAGDRRLDGYDGAVSKEALDVAVLEEGEAQAAKKA
jgi:hypothetical protein